jgi:hypothetical protein
MLLLKSEPSTRGEPEQEGPGTPQNTRQSAWKGTRGRKAVTVGDSSIHSFAIDDNIT